jgi:outer membrane protein, adhesin transport system
MLVHRLLLACLASALAAAGLSATVPAPPPGALPPLDPAFVRLLEASRENAPGLVSRLAQLEQALAGEMAARAPSLPRVQASAQFGGQFEQREIDGSRSFFTAFYNATASQPIYHWGALEMARERAALYTEVARRDVEHAARLAQLDVLRGWLGLATSLATEVPVQLRNNWASEDLAFERERVRAGEATEVGLRGSEDSLQSSTLMLTDVQASVARARRTLSVLAGAPVEGTPIVPAPADLQLVAAWAEQVSLSKTPSVTVLNLDTLIAAERLQQEIEGVRLRPRLGVSLNASRENRNADNDPLGRRQFVHSVGAFATVDWLLFDGYASRAALAQSRARQREHEASLRQAELELRNSLEAAALSVRLAASRLELVERRLAEVRAVEKLRREEHEIGLLSDRQLADVVLSTAEAEQAAIIGRADFHLTCASLILQAGGTLFPEVASEPSAAPQNHE